MLLRKSNCISSKIPPIIKLFKNRTTIGRSGDVKMDTTQGKEISKIHATIYRQLLRTGETWVLEDNNSLNGTLVNSKKIKKQALRSGDEIVFGAGAVYNLGDSVVSTEKAECRYEFYRNPPSVRFLNHFTPNIDNIEDFDDETCLVCYEPISNGKKLPCGHHFCRKCIKKWVTICLNAFQPCVCPMCRTEFSLNIITEPEIVFSHGFINVSSIDGILSDINISRKEYFEKADIFKYWDTERKTWFWKAFNKVKGNYSKRIVFLCLMKTVPTSIMNATKEELAQAAHNLDISVPENSDKEEYMLALLKCIYSTLFPISPYNYISNRTF